MFGTKVDCRQYIFIIHVKVGDFWPTI